jgi:hypothetical protein
MKMQMKNDLATTPFHIEQKLVSGFFDTSLFRHIPGHHHHFGNQQAVFGRYVIDASDMPLGNNQKMNRCVGFDIFKHHKIVICE